MRKRIKKYEDMGKIFVEKLLDIRKVPYPKKLKGQEVIIETQSLYDYVTSKVVVIDRIRGTIVKIDKYGVHLKNASITRYYNEKPLKTFIPFSTNMIVYHNTIRSIYILPPT